MSSKNDLSDVARELAASGSLRAAINTGNPVLARAALPGHEPTGITVDLAQEIGRRLQVPVTLVAYTSAGKVVEAVSRHEWDVAFLAVDPQRGETIAFSKPYIQIEGTYAVRADARYKTSAELDSAGVKVAVITGAAYDLFLSRNLRAAQVVRAPTEDGAIALFESGQATVLAGIRPALASYVGGRADVRVLGDRFMTVDQAIAVPKEKTAGAAYMQAFVAEGIASGFIDKIIRAHAPASS